MRLLAMIICSMLCCTGLHAVRQHYEQWEKERREINKNMTLEKLNENIKESIEYAFIYLDQFEENLYSDECDEYELCIKYYQNKIKEMDFGLCASDFCLLIENRARDHQWNQPDHCEICFHCDMWEAWSFFYNYELEMEELKTRAGL